MAKFATLTRVITWRTRVNRIQFGFGYLVLTGGATLLMNAAVFILAGVVGIDVALRNLHWIAPPFLLVVPLTLGLIAGRAHDLGAPGWPFVAFYCLPWPVWAVLMYSGLVLQIPFAVLAPAMIGAVFLIHVMLITFASLPGQKRTNRYGDAPAPGLWNDLRPSRA